MAIETHVHDGTAYRKIKRWYANDSGTTWRDLKKVYCHDGTDWRLVFKRAVWSQVGQITFATPGCAVSGGVLYANGSRSLWSFDGNLWTQIGGSGNDEQTTYLIDFGGILVSETYGTGGLGKTHSWNGSSWVFYCNSPTNDYYGTSGLCSDGEYLYGSSWTFMDGKVYRWTGSSWVRHDSGTGARMPGILFYGGTLYAARGSGVYYWTGSSWSQIGGNFTTYETRALVVISGVLYVAAGYFSNGYHYGVWAFDGSNWNKIGDDLGQFITNMATLNGELYASTDNGVFTLG
jgi:hypothetical protein